MNNAMADCPEVEALAAELALGIVLGSDRASALAHLGACASCRRLVETLTNVADPLLLRHPLEDRVDLVERRRDGSGSGRRLRAPGEPALGARADG